MIGYIYKITNNANGKVYLGSTTKTPEERFCQHLSDLKHNRHHNIHLQHAYDKYGESAFTITSKQYNIDSENELRLLEERYINFCWNSGNLYNLSKKGSGGDLVSYHPNNKEIRRKIGLASKHAYEKLTDEEKEAYAAKYKGDKNPNYGNKWSDEQRKHLSDFYKEYYKTHEHHQKGKKLEEIVGEEKAKELKRRYSERSKKMIGERNSFYGKHHSEETKRKISEKNIGKKNLTSAKPVIVNGVVYESAMTCAKELGLNNITVSYRARNGIYGFAYLDN